MATSSASAARPAGLTTSSCRSRQKQVAKIVHSGLSQAGLPLCAECGSLAGLAHFLRLLKETEHFRRGPQ